MKSIEGLQKIGFNVKAVVSHNHTSNMAIFRKFSTIFSYAEKKSEMFANIQSIHMLYNTVLTVKNLQSNLLCPIRLLLSPFSCCDLCKPITVAGGIVS